MFLLVFPKGFFKSSRFLVGGGGGGGGETQLPLCFTMYEWCEVFLLRLLFLSCWSFSYAVRGWFRFFWAPEIDTQGQNVFHSQISLQISWHFARIINAIAFLHESLYRRFFIFRILWHKIKRMYFVQKVPKNYFVLRSCQETGWKLVDFYEFSQFQVNCRLEVELWPSNYARLFISKSWRFFWVNEFFGQLSSPHRSLCRNLKKIDF